MPIEQRTKNRVDRVGTYRVGNRKREDKEKNRLEIEEHFGNDGLKNKKTDDATEANGTLINLLNSLYN